MGKPWLGFTFPFLPVAPPTLVFLGIMRTAGPKDTPGLILMAQSPVWGRVREEMGELQKLQISGRDRQGKGLELPLCLTQQGEEPSRKTAGRNPGQGEGQSQARRTSCPQCRLF